MDVCIKVVSLYVVLSGGSPEKGFSSTPEPMLCGLMKK